MFFEFQLSSDTLARIFRNQLHSLHLSVADSFSYAGMSLMVNRILILNTTSLRRMPSDVNFQVDGNKQTIQGFKAVIAQPLKFELVSEADLISNGPTPSTPIFSPELTILIDVTASEEIVVDKNNKDKEISTAQILFSFNSIEWGQYDQIIDDATKQQIENIISSRVKPIKRQLDTGSIDSLLDGVPLLITNAGATASSDG